MKKIILLLIAAGFLASLFGSEFHGDGRLHGPGEIRYEMSRFGSPTAKLRVEALVLGHRAGGAIDVLLVSQAVDIIPSMNSAARLIVSPDHFAEWKTQFQHISTGLRQVPIPGETVERSYENTLDPETAKPEPGLAFFTRGRWNAIPPAPEKDVKDR